MHPKELIRGPRWLRGWKGNELQRCIRKKKMVGNRMFIDDLHNLNKRISYLYKHFNRHGKYRQKRKPGTVEESYLSPQRRGTVLFLIRKGICILPVIKQGFFGICYPHTLFYSRCQFYSFVQTVKSDSSISPVVLGLDHLPFADQPYLQLLKKKNYCWHFLTFSPSCIESGNF